MIQTFRKYPFLTLKTNSRKEVYSKRVHSHEDISLGYIEKGKTLFNVQNQEYLLLPGDIVIIPAEVAHICTPENDDNYKFQMFYIDNKWWKDKLSISPCLFNTVARPTPFDFKNILNQIINNSIEKENLEKVFIQHLLEIVSEYKILNQTAELEIENIHNQIRELPQISISIDELASRAGLNKFSFIRKYAQRYGLTPHADIVNMRVQRAVLLFESNMDLTTIAFECGFSDQSHFIKQFKLYSGLRPQEYREALLSKK